MSEMKVGTAAARGAENRQLCRVAALDRPPLRFFVDGVALEAMAGDTVLTAFLTNGRRLRRFEFGAEDRAGFCLMGTCQDCWISQADGSPVRACTTLLAPDQHFATDRR